MTTSNKSGLKIETTYGRTDITINDYLDLIHKEQPHVVIAMAHEVYIGAKRKHKELAIKLTKEWWNIIINDYNN